MTSESLNQPPRVWTVFLAALAALLAAIAVQTIAAVVVIVRQVSNGIDVQEAAQKLPAIFSTPAAFVILGLFSQLAMGMVAFFAARFSPLKIGPRLGLFRPSLSPGDYPIIVIGALLPLGIGVMLAHLLALVIPPDPSAAMLYKQMTASWAIPFILFIALAPGFVEELLFRGYVQTRFLQRWRPWVAILVTSTVFGLFHITPHAIANAFVIGLWIGVIAWRTGSIWPGVLCHAFINGSWNIWQVGQRLWGFPEKPPLIVSVLGGCLIVGCFLLSIRILWRKKETG